MKCLNINYKNVLYYRKTNQFLAVTGKVNFDGFCEIAGYFLEEEDADAMQQELKEAFRLYDREGTDTLRQVR